jgi:hypothetical protein
MTQGLYRPMTADDQFLPIEITGSSFRAFCDTLGQNPYKIRNPEDQQRIINGAIKAASLFLPHSTGSNIARTSLLVGNVQSGKTTSIRGIICLAADSSVPIVVLMTGTKRVLYNQTLNEMTSFINSNCQRSIKYIDTSSQTSATNEILRCLSNFYSPSLEIRERRQTLFLPILKNAGNIERLIQLLNPIVQQQQQIHNFLIIDDEGDEFSLNTTANTPNNQGSACYNACRNLRSLLPCATNYLQVTATPQGPLLISQDDPLSPEYASLSEPGVEYAGGEDYFPSSQNIHPLILHVPDTERPDTWVVNPQTRSQIPPTLQQAFHYFLAAGSYLLAKDILPYVTMLVHPATAHATHDYYQDYILRLVNTYLGLEELDSYQFKIDIFEVLREYYRRLGCLEEIESSLKFRDIVYSKLMDMLIYKEVKLINSNNQLPDESGFWGVSSSYFILGAQCIARGFVVKHLITTYLPRDTNPGNPNAFLGQIDTIQQQARFFGYKQSYINFCRVYLRPRIHTQFSEYVIHEGVMRNIIRRTYRTRNPYAGTQLPIPVQYRPTRRNILSHQFPIANFGSSWNLERFPHLLDCQSLLNRQMIFSDFIGTCFGQSLPTNERVPSTSTNITVADLVVFLDRLSRIEYPVIDKSWITTTVSMLGYLIEKSARGYVGTRAVKVYLFPALRSHYPTEPPIMSSQSVIDSRFVRRRFETNDFSQRLQLDRFELNPHGGASNDRDSSYCDLNNPSIHLFHFGLPHYAAILKRLSELGETPNANDISSFADIVSASEELRLTGLSCADLDAHGIVPIIPSFGLRLPDLYSVIDL